MVLINPDEKREYRMDGYLKSNLDVIKDKVHDDWDFVIVVDGMERSGKSVIAQQIGKYLYSELNLDCIAFNPKEFEEKVKIAPKYSCVIFDEAFSGMASGSYATKINKALKRMMVEIGQKNLFIILVIPSFFELERYHAVHRSIALINVYTGDNLQRGFFKFYSKDKKAKLYFEGRKEYNYNVVKANFFGNFPKPYMVDEKEYRERKSNCMLVMNNELHEEVKFNKYLAQRDELITILKENYNIKLTDLEQKWKKRSKNALSVDQMYDRRLKTIGK